jgi:hypothetical protein
VPWNAASATPCTWATGHPCPTRWYPAYQATSHHALQVCEEQRCGKSFHGDCLVQWLRSLASTRHSFDTLFGPCHTCTPLSVLMRPRRVSLLLEAHQRQESCVVVLLLERPLCCLSDA